MSLWSGVGSTVGTKGGDAARAPCTSSARCRHGCGTGGSAPQWVQTPRLQRMLILSSAGEAGSPAASSSVPAAAQYGRGDSRAACSRGHSTRSTCGTSAGTSSSPPGRPSSSGRREPQVQVASGSIDRLQQPGQEPAMPIPSMPPATHAHSQQTAGGSSSSNSSSPRDNGAMPSLVERPVRNNAAATAASAPTLRQGPFPPPPPLSSSSRSGGGSSGGGSTRGALPVQQYRESPSLRMLVGQQRRHRRQLQQQPTAQQSVQGQQQVPLGVQGQQQLQQHRQQPAFLSYSQQRQQHEQQQLLQQTYFRHQQLRVPYWVRAVAEAMLQAAAEAAKEGNSGSSSSPEGLGGYDDHPEAVLREFHRLLPPFQAPSALQQQQLLLQQRQEAPEGSQALDGEQEQQQQQDVVEGQQEEEEERSQQEGVEQLQQQQQLEQAAVEDGSACESKGAAVPAGAGDIFAAELANILSHYEQSAAEEAAYEVDSGAGTGTMATSSSREQQEPKEAAAPGSDPAPERPPPRQRRVDEGGLVLLLRAVALMGEGMRSALALLLAADRYGGGYPTRSPDIMSSMLRMANSLMEDKAAVVLVGLAREWGVPLDRAMWQSVLDVCAKAGKADVVQDMFREMKVSGTPPDAVAHTILVMAHEKAGQWRAALDAYEHMRAEGLQRSSFTYRALVSALVGADRLGDACEILDAMAQDGVAGNAVVYQTLINAFLERGQQDKVDWLLERMLRDGVRFSHQAVGRLTGFCLSRNQPYLAFQLFKTVREMGLLNLDDPSPKATSSNDEPEEVLAIQENSEEEAAGGLLIEPEGGIPAPAAGGSALNFMDSDASLAILSMDDDDESALEVSSSTRSSAIDKKAQAAVSRQERQQEKTRAEAAYSYCRMIAACHRARLLEEGWCVYGWMLEDGLRPDRSTYSRLISLCAFCPTHRGDDAEALYERLMAEGVELDVFMYLHLVTALGGVGEEVASSEARWPAVLRMLHGMHVGMPNYRDTHVQTVAVSLAAKHGRLRDALAVYRLMLQDGVQPKAPTFNALIAACMRANAPTKGFRFFDVMRGMGVQADVVTISTLIACCERLSDWRRAIGMWDWMLEQGLEPDIICYNTMISCMERCNQPHRALAVFEQMAGASAESSSATLAALCNVFTRREKWDKLRAALQVKEWMEAQGEDPERVTYAQLAERASKGGNWKRALDLFDGMESRLGIGGTQPNSVTYAAAITACARLADWRRALELKDQMLARGLPPSVIVYNSALAACEAAAQLEAGLELMEEMRALGVQRDQYTYSTLISCCYHGKGQLEPAMRLFQEMQDEGLMPNTIVVNALLSVCATIGAADAAVQVYRHVTDTLQIPPDEITMHCMVEVMGRSRRWTEGLSFFVAAYQQLGSHHGVMHLDLSQPDPAAQLDLHFLSVMGARTVLRGWLLSLKRRALAGERLAAESPFRIVTGWGRNSTNNVPRLKPEVARMLQQEMGPPLIFHEPASNLGVYHVEPLEMYDWLLTRAELGFEPEEEEEAWQLMEQLAAFQRQEQQQPSPAAAPGPDQQRRRQPPPATVPAAKSPLQYQAYEQVAWLPPAVAEDTSAPGDQTGLI